MSTKFYLKKPWQELDTIQTEAFCSIMNTLAAKRNTPATILIRKVDNVTGASVFESFLSFCMIGCLSDDNGFVIYVSGLSRAGSIMIRNVDKYVHRVTDSNNEVMYYFTANDIQFFMKPGDEEKSG